MQHRDTSDPIAWARRINRGWLVRGGLDHTTDAWLDHLEQSDPARLLACCDIARALSRGPDRTLDPKPWFYAGLFSLASEAEARRYLPTHHFTAAAIPALAHDEALSRWVADLSPASGELLARLRAAVLTHARSDPPSAAETQKPA
ncbi:MAG: hypothetical protein WCP45_17035 [Verrucomicrobiota bacterium]